MTTFLRALYSNHVLANLVFVLVLLVGAFAYLQLPRQQDPTINFNWIFIKTILPGASALDVEKKVTDPLEDALRNVKNVRFMSSNSRTGISSILVRFKEMDQRLFDKRVADLRREIQNKQEELPAAAHDPVILEITSANAFPVATVAVVGQALDENLRVQARNIKKDLQRFRGIDRVDAIGLPDPELQVAFDPAKLENLGLVPGQIADTVQAFFQDVAAGDVRLGGQDWLVRLAGSDAEPVRLANRPVVGIKHEIPLREVARIQRHYAQPTELAGYAGKPAVMLAVMKEAGSNTLELVGRINAYLAERNTFAQQTGVELVLIDDQTGMTRSAIGLMQNNALIGLLLVLLVAWLFLGTRIALLTVIGIPFILAGIFWILLNTGETLNIMVLLGIVIVLGMLVDDAVVVVEGIYYRLQQGMQAMEAALHALREVAAPVTTAVLTTIAAFAPLVLLPGILGDFMGVVPLVVIIGLALSLLESFWMLPTHIIAAGVNFRHPSRVQLLRQRLTHKLQIHYVRLLVKALRRRFLTLMLVVSLFFGAIGVLAAGWIKTDFFAADTVRLFYVNIEMPPETSLEQTFAKLQDIEQKVKSHFRKGEVRAVIHYAGNIFTETEPRLGDHLGQIMVGLQPKTPALRSVQEMIDAMRDDVMTTPGPVQINFLQLSGGPPTGKPISIKVRGDDYVQIRAAADIVRQILEKHAHIIDIGDDANKGRHELVLRLDTDAVVRTGLNPLEINRTLQLLVDGLVVADMRDKGEKLEIRVLGVEQHLANIQQLLDFRMPLADGGSVPLHTLVKATQETGLGNIRHYNFRRAITVEADLAPDTLDTRTANQWVMDAWAKHQADFPNIDLDFTGELDDINESMDSMLILFIAGVGVMFAILGAQFGSYFQPLMILSTVLMAFTGVTLGLWVSANPLSLYTLYGVVALSGIAVNSAIVLISAGNQRLHAGMSVLHATLYAARRRVIPILITSLTTIAGLFSLATGLGGKSLIWGPVANAIVWGLAFSTMLTLIVVPLLYQLFMGRSRLVRKRAIHKA